MTPFLPPTTKTTIRSEKRVNSNLFRNKKKVVFSLSLPPAVVVQSVCLPFLAHSRFFPHRNKRFYNCLKKQREGEEEQKDVQRGGVVVCWRVVVVVRSKRVVVGVVVKRH